jgi:hypothetical protein
VAIPEFRQRSPVPKIEGILSDEPPPELPLRKLEPPVKLTHLRRSKVTHQNAGEDLEFLLAER